VTTLSPKDLALQKRDESMFTSNVRRDIYDILRNPYRPNEGAPAPLSWQSTIRSGDSQFGAVLLAKGSLDLNPTVTPSKWDAHAFAVDQKEVGDGGPSSNHDDDDDSESSSSFSSEQQEYTIFNDKQLMTAIAERGSVNPESVAITKAFEAWVEETARNYWGDTQISKLSVDFLVAFGNELTE